MNRFGRKLSLWLFALLALAFLLTVGPRPGLAARKTCLDCHKEAKAYASQKFVHAPLAKQDCEACHKPHGFANKLVLKQEGDALCYSCHKEAKEKFALKTVHPPVKKGNCTACHNPHASGVKGLLKETKDGTPVCFTCHEGLKQVFTAAGAHQPFRRGECSLCHPAHASDQDRLLVKTGRDLCFSCHSAEKVAAKKPHSLPSVQNQDCSS